MTLFLLFSHTLTPEQLADAKQNWQVKRVVSLPDDLQAVWSNVPPDIGSIKDYIAPLSHWLGKQAKAQDLALVQGDYGATYLLVTFCWQHQIIPLYCTTNRSVKETLLPDGSVFTERFFIHQQFRMYEK